MPQAFTASLVLPAAVCPHARRYLELQAAYFHSWLCPSSSALAASIQDAPLASPSVAAWSSSTQPYVVIDAKAATAAATAAAGSTVDAAAVLMAAGCVHVQSFVLLDIKWSLQAQVGRQGRGPQTLTDFRPVLTWKRGM